MNNTMSGNVYEGTENSTCETTPWVIWRHSVEVAAVRLGADISDLNATEKLLLWYRSGEPVWMAVDGLRQLARGLRVAKAESADGRKAIAAWRSR
jgi:hypothetical protein